MLVIAGGKGGSGKTTTALGIAAAFDEETLVVDVDRDMPNLHAMAGVDREPALTTSDPAAAAQPHPDHPTVSILSAPPASMSDAAVGRALNRLDRTTEKRIVVDSPGGAGPDAVAPLSAASLALLVSTACVPSLRDAAKTAAMARTVETPVVGAVLTRSTVEPRGVTSLLDCRVLGTVPDVPPQPLTSPAIERAYHRVAQQIPTRENRVQSTPGEYHS